jgi:O-antigen/teichoic acid export membrane protein
MAFRFDTWRRIKEAYSRTDKTKKLLRGSLGVLVLRPSGLIFRFAASVLLARTLGALGYGVYAYAITWFGFLVIPTTLGLDHVVLRYVAAYKETKTWGSLRGLLRFSFGLGALAGVAAAIVGIAILGLLPGSWSVTRQAIAITFLILPIAVVTQVRQSSLRALDHPTLALLPETIVYPGSLALLVVVASFLSGRDVSVLTVAWMNGAAWLGAFLVGTYLLWRRLPVEIQDTQATFDRPRWMSMVPPLIFIGGAYHLVSRGEVLMLGYLGGSRDIGLYTVASRVAELTQYMYEAMTLVGGSLFSAIYASGDRQELQRFTTLCAKTILWGSIPVLLVFNLAAPWLLGLFGPEFVEGTTVLRLLTTAFFLSGLSGFVIVMLYMTGHQRDVAVVMGAMGLSNLGLSSLLIPRFGIVGAAISCGITVVLLKGILVAILYRRVGVLSLPITVMRQRAPAPSMEEPTHPAEPPSGSGT